MSHIFIVGSKSTKTILYIQWIVYAVLMTMALQCLVYFITSQVASVFNICQCLFKSKNLEIGYYNGKINGTLQLGPQNLLPKTDGSC